MGFRLLLKDIPCSSKSVSHPEKISVTLVDTFQYLRVETSDLIMTEEATFKQMMTGF